MRRDRNDRSETICEQTIGSLAPVMERALRQGASPQFVLRYIIGELESSLMRWHLEGNARKHPAVMKRTKWHGACTVIAFRPRKTTRK